MKHGQNHCCHTKTLKKTHLFAERGFTLVEIMIVVVIIAIIAFFAAPEISNFGPNSRVKAAARGLHYNLQKMKIEAVKRNSDVVMLITSVVCSGLPTAVPASRGSIQIFIDDGNGGGTAGDGIHNGTEEWLEFTDDSGDGPSDTDYDMPQNTALCNSTFAATAPRPSNSVAFNSQALVVDNNVGVFTVNNDRGRTYQVTVTTAGGLKTEKL